MPKSKPEEKIKRRRETNRQTAKRHRDLVKQLLREINDTLPEPLEEDIQRFNILVLRAVLDHLKRRNPSPPSPRRPPPSAPKTLIKKPYHREVTRIIAKPIPPKPTSRSSPRIARASLCREESSGEEEQSSDDDSAEDDKQGFSDLPSHGISLASWSEN